MLGNKLTDQEARIILAYADANMNCGDAANALSYHRNTIVYHLTQIHKRTGQNPQSFYDLVSLTSTAREILRGKS